MATRQDLIALVLENLGVLAAGQSASAEDRQAIDRRIDPKLRELERREVFAGLSADSLDDAVFLYVGDIIAAACRTPFGITGSKADGLTKAAADAEAMLKAMARQFNPGASTATYDVVQDVLERLGVVSPGQAPTAQDRGIVGSRVPPMLLDLRAREIITVTDLDGAEAAMVPHLATILVSFCAPAFGVAGADLVPLVAAAGVAEQHLRTLARQFDVGVGTSGAFNVAQGVLELLGVVEGGQTASAKDVAVVSARYAPLLADLRARHIVDLPSVDGADASTKHFLAAILAARCALLFGVGEPVLTGLRAEEVRAEASLRATARQIDTGAGTAGTLDAPQSVLEILGVVGPGQTATAKDRAVITTRLPSIFADLKNRQIITVSAFETADASVQPHLVTIIAGAVAPLFGIEAGRLQALVAEATRAEAALRIISRQVDAGLATGGTFDLIQVALENLGAVAVGRTATDKDRAIVSGRVTAVLDDLRTREVISLPSLAGAAPSTLLQLSVILTSACAMAFGIPAEVRGQLRAEAERAEIALRAQARQLDTGSATSGTFDLPQAVLEALGVIAAGQTASAKDRSVVAARVSPMLADLRDRDVISIPSIDGASDSTKLHLAALLAARCGPLFGVSDAMLSGLKGEAAGAEAGLRRIARQVDVGSASQAAYDPIQATLERLGVVAAGQTATAADRNAVSARVAPLLADLRLRDVIALPSLAAADAGTLLHITTLLAAACVEAFDLPAEMRAALAAQVPGAEAALRLAARQLDTGVGTTGAFDVVQSVLEMAGVVVGGQTASAKDRAVVTARVAVTLADLRQREVIGLASIETADPATLPHLAVILAARCAPLLGADAATVQGIKTEAATAEAALRRIARQIDTGTATSGSFDPVQSVLEALGVVVAGQTASQRDRAVVSARAAPMLADLAQREIIAVASLAEADAATKIHLATILTLACAVPFGVPAEPFQAPAVAAEAALRLIGRQFDGGVATSGTFDVVQTVLENLGVVAAGYTGSAKDRAVVSARVAPTLADLRLREIASIASLDAADPGVLIHLSVILTAACAQAFGKSVEVRAALAADASRAETALRSLARQLDTGTATSGAYDVVQAALEMLGVIEPGQTGSDRDRAVVFARVQPKLMELYGRDICGVTDLSQLTPELQGAFGRILAADCLLSFPAVPAPRAAMLLGMVPAAEQTLRWQSFVYDARPPLRVESFWGRRHGRPDPGAC